MNLGLLPSIGGGLADTARSGQIDRFLNYYVRTYVESCQHVYYFSYLSHDLLENYTSDPDILSSVTVIPKQNRLPYQLYAFHMAAAARAQLASCDVLRVFQTTGAIPAMISKWRYGTPYVTTYGYKYHEFANVEGRHVSSLLWRFLGPVILRQSTGIIVTTRELFDYVRQFVSPEKIHLIPNGVDINIFAPAPTLPPSGKPVILYVGRLNRQKNLDSLLKAVAGLDRPVQVRLVGDGPLLQNLKTQAQELGVDAVFSGVISHSELPDAFRQASVFVLPSFIEGHPKVLIEAMSCGLPCVASDCDGSRLLITHRQNGLLFDPYQPAMLTQCLEQVLNNRTLATQLGQAARQTMVSTLDVRNLLSQEVAILQQVAQQYTT